MSPSPLGLFLFVSIFVQILPGINLATFLAAPMVQGVQNLISEETLLRTYSLTMWSLSFLMLFLYVLHLFMKIDFNLKSIDISSFQCKTLTLLSFVIIGIKLKSVGGIPLLYAISGDISGAAQLKSDILLGNVGAGGLAAGYLFLYIPLLSFLCALIYKLTKKKSVLFYINLLMSVIYLTYDFQKAGLIILFFLVFLIMLRFGRVKFALAVPVIAIICLVLIFIVLNSGGSSANDSLQMLSFALEQLMNRTFIGQMEGSYMIFEAIKPSFMGYVFHGFPLASSLGFASPDPSAEVVRIFFPGSSEAWVNSNTYNLAHAWSIFGVASVLISPLVFVVNIALLDVLRRTFAKVLGGVSNALFIVVVMTLPFNNNFTSFLYCKPALGFLIVSLPLVLISQHFLSKLQPRRVSLELSSVP